jgi:hypothetical protein
MRDFNETSLGNNKIPFLKLFFVVLAIILVVNLLNINLEVANYRLSKSIDKLDEEKNILRAKYLSDTSMSNLVHKAQDFHMSEISNANTIKISSKLAQTKLKELEKNHAPLKKDSNYYFFGF